MKNFDTMSRTVKTDVFNSLYKGIPSIVNFIFFIIS